MISLALGALGAVLAASGMLAPKALTTFAVLCGVMGFAGNFFTVPYIAIVQSFVPADWLDRVLALMTCLMAFAAPLGLLLAGPTAEIVGVPMWLFASGVIILFMGGLYHLLSKQLTI